MDQNVYTPEDKYYDYPDRPVPHDKRKSPINIAVVTTGMAVAMSTLYTGSALAEVMNFKKGTIAIVVGSVILAILASLTGGIGANQGICISCFRWGNCIYFQVWFYNNHCDYSHSCSVLWLK